MNVKDNKVKTSMRNFVLALILLLLTNILMGVILVSMSKKTLREQINQRMLDIANTAAHQLDGDVLRDLKAEDEQTEGYQQALETLRSFQENIELDYIYGIRAEEDGSFTFTIDPTVEDPGEFGFPIQTTDALIEASHGTPSVDKDAYTDSWGRFYSAYSPVFDSDGSVAGIVGVDFDADWYEGKLGSHWAAAVILTMIAMTIGIVLSFIIMSQNRKRFTTMLENMAELDRETQKLDQIIMQSSIKKLDLLPESESALLKTLAAGETEKRSSSDEYDELNTSIAAVYSKLHAYLKYIESEANKDATTGVLNKAAYKQKLKTLDEAIANKTAEFAVIYLDVNGLKKTYTYRGFEAGDKLMFESGKHLKEVFGMNAVYHIVGDEFVILLEGKASAEIEQRFEKLYQSLAEYNSKKEPGYQLSLSTGVAVYNRFRHDSYRAVFIDAKNKFDVDKASYYQKLRETEQDPVEEE